MASANELQKKLELAMSSLEQTKAEADKQFGYTSSDTTTDSLGQGVSMAPELQSGGGISSGPNQNYTPMVQPSSGGVSSGSNQNFTPNVQPTSNLNNVTPTATSPATAESIPGTGGGVGTGVQPAIVAAPPVNAGGDIRTQSAKGYSSDGPVPLTQENLDKIVSGELKVPQQTIDAIQSGNYEIVREPVLEWLDRNLGINEDTLQLALAESGAYEAFIRWTGTIIKSKLTQAVAKIKINKAYKVVNSEPVKKTFTQVNLFDDLGAKLAEETADDYIKVSSKGSSGISQSDRLLSSFAKNSKSDRLVSEAFSKTVAQTVTRRAVGYVVGTVVLGGSITGQSPISSDRDVFLTEYPTAVKSLREVGLNDMADELEIAGNDFEDGIGEYYRYATVFGKEVYRENVNEQNRLLTNANIALKTYKDGQLVYVTDKDKELAEGKNISLEDAEKAYDIDPTSDSGKMYPIMIQTEQTEKDNAKINAISTRLIGADYNIALKDGEFLAQVNKDLSDGKTTLLTKIYAQFISDKEIADDRAYSEYITKQENAYNEAQDESDRDYAEGQQAEQRAYDEGQQEFADATATEDSGSSSLNFGILNSSGEEEFVDRDKASIAYFGVPWEELDPAKRRLLMLSKGGN